MKKLFEKMKSYSFWVSFSGALIIFLNCLGNIFHFQIQNEVVEDVIMSIAGLLVVLGFVTKETGDESEEDEKQEIDKTNEDEDMKNEENEEEKSSNESENSTEIEDEKENKNTKI